MAIQFSVGSQEVIPQQRKHPVSRLTNDYDEDDAIDELPLTFRRFFFLAVKLSWPLSVFESLSDSLELELEDELELLELSDAKPVLSCRFTSTANFANSGSLS